MSDSPQIPEIDETTVPPERWASDGPDVVAGVEDVDQDPELLVGDDVVEIYVEPEL